jgi:iron(III) transport system permease protein
MSAHPMDTAISVPVDRFVPARRSAPAGPARPQGRSRHWDRWWLGALVLGALAWLLATIALPVASLLGRSFWDDAGRFTGLAQFIAYARMPGVAQSPPLMARAELTSMETSASVWSMTMAPPEGRVTVRA